MSSYHPKDNYCNHSRNNVKDLEPFRSQSFFAESFSSKTFDIQINILQSRQEQCTMQRYFKDLNNGNYLSVYVHMSRFQVAGHGWTSVLKFQRSAWQNLVNMVCPVESYEGSLKKGEKRGKNFSKFNGKLFSGWIWWTSLVITNLLTKWTFNLQTNTFYLENIP